MSKEPPMSIGELLHQDKIWIARNGTDLKVLRLDDMELSHLKSLRAWLLRSADSIQYGLSIHLHQMLSRVNGEMAEQDLEHKLARLEGQEPEEWMREQTLFIALTERLESVAVDKFHKTDLAVMLHLAKMALSAPPGTHTQRQLSQIEALRKKLDGTGKNVP